MVERIFKNAVRQLWRGGWLTAASVLVMTLTFFVISVFAVAARGSNLILNYFESKAQITAFFKDAATEEEILAIKNELEQTGLTAEVVYVSKAEALQIYLGQHQDEPILLESITANIFPASLDARAKNVGDLPRLVSVLEKSENVEEIIFYKDIIESLKNWVGSARLVGIGLISVLVVMSVLILLISVGMVIANQKSEIEVMRLIGASNWYIRGPFILQGAFSGALAAVAAVLLLALSSPLISPLLAGLLQGIPLAIITPQFILVLLIVEVCAAALLGGIGSLLAVWKYLRY